MFPRSLGRGLIGGGFEKVERRVSLAGGGMVAVRGRWMGRRVCGGVGVGEEGGGGVGDGSERGGGGRGMTRKGGVSSVIESV